MSNKKIILTTLSPKTHRTSEENLGIEYLKASLVREKYDVEIIDAWLKELEVEEVYNKILDDMIDLLDKMDELNPIYDDMDWKNIYKARKEAKDKFFKLFSEYFYGFWD